MLILDRSGCWADAKTIGLVIGFSRIILLSNVIAIHTISTTIEIFIQEAILPLLLICFDICWIHGIYTEKPKLLLPTLVMVTIEIAAIISLAIYQHLMIYVNFKVESWAVIMFAIFLVIEIFIWFTGYTLYKRMKKTRGFQNIPRIEYVDIIKVV